MKWKGRIYFKYTTTHKTSKDVHENEREIGGVGDLMNEKNG